MIEINKYHKVESICWSINLNCSQWLKSLYNKKKKHRDQTKWTDRQEDRQTDKRTDRQTGQKLPVVSVSSTQRVKSE
jgi:hypothetical protein